MDETTIRSRAAKLIKKRTVTTKRLSEEILELSQPTVRAIRRGDTSVNLKIVLDVVNRLK